MANNIDLYNKYRNDTNIGKVFKRIATMSEGDKKRYPYLLGVNVNEKRSNLYLGFESIIDKINYIKNNPYGNLIDVFNSNIRKFYFDIDIKKPITENVLKRYVLPYIKTAFSTYYQNQLKDKDIPHITDNIVFVKRTDDGLIKSVHIYYIRAIGNIKTIRDFVENCGLTKKLKEYDCIFDTNPYNVNDDKYQHFYLPKHTKYGDTSYFEPLRDNDKHNDIRHQIISHIGLDPITFTIPELVDLTPYNKKTENEIENVILTQTKSEAIQHDINIQSLNDDNIIDILLDVLPNEFYNQNGKTDYWKKLTLQLVLWKFKNIDKWLSESAKKSNYSYKQNRLFADRCDDKYLSYNIQKYLDILNKKYNLYLLWDIFKICDDVLIKWISNKCSMTENKVKKIIEDKHHYLTNKIKSLKKDDWMIEINQKFHYDITTGLLTDIIDKQIYYYPYESRFDGQYSKNTNNFKTITKDKLKKTTQIFMDGDKRLLGIKAIWGTGKTYTVVNTILGHSVDNNKRVLIVTESNTLNKSNLKMFQPFGAVNHLNTEVIFKEHNIVITSLESLIKTTGGHFNIDKFDYILLDEYESIIAHYLSPTIDAVDDAEDILERIKIMLKRSEKIIMLDCDLSIERVDLIQQLVNDKTILLNCDYNRWSDYNYNLYINEDDFLKEMFDDVFERNKKLVFCSLARAKCEGVYETFTTSKRIANKRVLLVTSHTVEIWINGEKIKLDNVQKDIYTFKDKFDVENDKQTKTMLLNQIKSKTEMLNLCKYNNREFLDTHYNEAIEELKLDVLIHSPTIKTGVSVDIEYFDKLYSHACIGSCNAREFNQMLHRQRILKDKIINIFSNTGLKPTMKLLKRNPSKINKFLISQYEKINNNNPDVKWIETNDFNRNLQTINYTEHYDSKFCFIQEMIGRLTFNHNIKVNMIGSFDDDESEIAKIVKRNSKLRDNKIIGKIATYKNLSDKNYLGLIDSKDVSKTEQIQIDIYKTIRSININKYVNCKTKNINDFNKACASHDNDDMNIYDRYTYNYNDEYDIRTNKITTAGNYCNYYYNGDKCVFYRDDPIMINNIIVTDYRQIIKSDDKWIQNKYFNKNIIKDVTFTDIRRDIYDKRLLIEHSREVARLTYSNELRNLYNILKPVKIMKMKDKTFIDTATIDANKVAITRKLLSILGSTPNDLIYNRIVLNEGEFKKKLDDNKEWIRKDLNEFLIDSYKFLDIDVKLIDIKEFSANKKNHYTFFKLLMNSLFKSLNIFTIYKASTGKEAQNQRDTNIMIVQYGSQKNSEGIKFNTKYPPLKYDINEVDDYIWGIDEKHITKSRNGKSYHLTYYANINEELINIDNTIGMMENDINIDDNVRQSLYNKKMELEKRLTLNLKIQDLHLNNTKKPIAGETAKSLKNDINDIENKLQIASDITTREVLIKELKSKYKILNLIIRIKIQVFPYDYNGVKKYTSDREYTQQPPKNKMDQILEMETFDDMVTDECNCCLNKIINTISINSQLDLKQKDIDKSINIFSNVVNSFNPNNVTDTSCYIASSVALNDIITTIENETYGDDNTDINFKAYDNYFKFFKINPEFDNIFDKIKEDFYKYDEDNEAILSNIKLSNNILGLTKNEKSYSDLFDYDTKEVIYDEDEYMKLIIDANSNNSHNSIYENTNIKKYEKRKNQILNNDWNRYNSDYRMECLFNFEYDYDDDDSISNYIMDDSEHLDYGDELN